MANLLQVHAQNHTRVHTVLITPTQYHTLHMVRESAGLYKLVGETTQAGVPSPDTPIPMVNTYKAGTYQIDLEGVTWQLTLDDDLRSAGDVADTLWIDTHSRTSWVDKKTGNITLVGSSAERWAKGNGGSDGKSNRFETQVAGAKRTQNKTMCNYFASSMNGGFAPVGCCRMAWTYLLFNPPTSIIPLDDMPAWVAWLPSHPTTVHYPLDKQIKSPQPIIELDQRNDTSSVEISNTVNAPLQQLEIIGCSNQNKTDISPSPDYPSPIQSVCNFDLMIGHKTIHIPYTLRSFKNGETVVAQDRLIVDKTNNTVFIQRNTSTVVLDDSRDFVRQTVANGAVRFSSLTLPDAGGVGNTEESPANCYCTHFLGRAFDQLFKSCLSIGVATWTGRIDLVIPLDVIGAAVDDKDTIMVQKLKNHLKSQIDAGAPVTVQYITSSTTIEDITDTETGQALLQAPSTQYYTSITTSDPLQPMMSVQALVMGR